MNKCLLLFCVLPFAIAASQEKTKPAVDDVPRTIRTDRYLVQGETLAELSASMKAHRPHAHNAFTEWYIDWNYSFDISADKWKLRDFDLRVQVRYTMPQWSPPDGVDPEVVAEWERFLKAVVFHEQGHAEIGLRCASEIREVIGFTTWQGKDRAEVKAKIDAKCQSILKRFRASEVAYDEDTDHGRTQGARLESKSSDN